MERKHTHAASRGRKLGREQEQDGSQSNIDESDLQMLIEHGNEREWTYDVQNPAECVGQDKVALGKSVTSAEAVDGDRDSVGKIQHDHGSGDNGIECASWVSITII